MARAIIEKDGFESLNSALKAEYREGTKAEGLEGKYVLKVEEVDGWAMENVKALKSSMSRAKQERDDARKIVKELGDDFSVDEYKEAMGELEKLRKGTGDDRIKAQIESEKKQLTDKFNRDIKASADQLAARDKEIEELLITSEATRSLTEHKGNVTLLLPHVKSRCRVARGANGKPFAQIVGDDGNPVLTMKQGSDAPMGIGEFVESLKSNATYAPAFVGSGASGTSGKNGQGAGSGGGANGNQNNSGNGGQGGTAGINFVQRLRDSRRAKAGQ